MGVEERRQRERQARKKAILAAARRLFNQQGFGATTMDEVAEAAELSKGAVYHYFLSKQDILGSLQIENMAYLTRLFEEDVVSIQDPAKRLEALARTYLRYVIENHSPGQPLYFLQSDFALSEMSEPLRQEIIETLARLVGYVQSAINTCMEAGLLPPETDPVKLTFVFWGAAIGCHALQVKLAAFLPIASVDGIVDECLKLFPGGRAPTAT